MKKKHKLLRRIVSLALSAVVGITTLGSSFVEPLTAKAGNLFVDIQQVWGPYYTFKNLGLPNNISAFCIEVTDPVYADGEGYT